MSVEAYKITNENFLGISVEGHLYKYQKSLKQFQKEVMYKEMIEYFPYFYPGTTHIAQKDSVGFFCFETLEGAKVFRDHCLFPFKIRFLKVSGECPYEKKYMLNQPFSDIFEFPNWKSQPIDNIISITKDTLLFGKIKIIEEIFNA